LDTGTELDGPTRVTAGAGVVLDPRHVLEAVRVDDERAPADAAADEVVAGVADDQAQVVLARKVNAGLDVSTRRSQDHIDAVVAQRAGGGRVGLRAASVVGEVGPKGASRLVNATSHVSYLLAYLGIHFCHQARMGEDLLPLLARKVGRRISTPGGVVGRYRSQGTLEGVVARRTGRDMHAQPAVDGGVQLIPGRRRGPAPLSDVALAVVTHAAEAGLGKGRRRHLVDCRAVGVGDDGAVDRGGSIGFGCRWEGKGAASQKGHHGEEVAEMHPI
jgi:hypothetical protein